MADSELRWNMESIRERDVMAGKTAPASLMQFSSAHSNDACCSPANMDRNVELMKAYRSAPNIDLLCHTEVGRATPLNEAKDILPGIEPVSTGELPSKSIPEIVVVCSSDENVSMVETCAQSHEPDIVQSTKSGSLPRQGVVQQPAQPVAPPRKKRFKTTLPLSADSADEVWLFLVLYLAIYHPSGCIMVSGIVIVVVGGGICNRSQMRTNKCTCLIFGVSIG